MDGCQFCIATASVVHTQESGVGLGSLLVSRASSWEKRHREAKSKYKLELLLPPLSSQDKYVINIKWWCGKCNDRID